MRNFTLACLSLVVFCFSAKCASLSSYDKQAKELLSKMTLEEKIGQMTQAENCKLQSDTDIQKYFLGSVLSGGNADPENGNSLQAWTDLYDRYQKQALQTRLAIPILYGIDALHGHNNVLGAVIFPHNIGLGCTRDPNLVREIARITALEIRATGINWTFAPCVTVPQDIRWGRTYEGFSENTELVKILGAAQVRGYQGGDLSNPLSVLACAKHYIGDGGTKFGTSKGQMLDQGDVQTDEPALRKIFLSPYKDAIDQGVGTIMPSYSSFNGLKCSANKHLLTEVLKGELGFQGFLISDYKAIKQIDPDFNEAVKISVNAGMDMAMEPNTYDQFFVTLKKLAQTGDVPMTRIDDAVTRILRVKFAMGLMDKNRSVLADRSLHKEFGSADHRQVARQAVRESLVLLKNEKNLLPISKNISRIHVAGKSADDIGNQCGGWTIQWQGESGNITSGATTVLQAIKNSVSPDTKITFSKNGDNAQGAQLGIAVIGETPYAEYYGDVRESILEQQDIETVKNLKKANIPVLVILISGRPMIINDVLEQADAFIAAWLPGSEGPGVADVLFGDYKPTGKLSFTWPKSPEQIPLSAIKDEPLFRYGYGLSYTAN
jgi:beta-glucosidase